MQAVSSYASCSRFWPDCCSTPLYDFGQTVHTFVDMNEPTSYLGLRQNIRRATENISVWKLQLITPRRDCLFICDLIRNTFTYLLIIPCASPMLAKRQWCSSCNREDDCESGFALVNASQTWRSQMSTLPSYKSPHPGGEWHAHFTVAIVVC